MRATDGSPHVVLVTDSALLQMGFESLAGSAESFHFVGFARNLSDASPLIATAEDPIVVVDVNGHQSGAATEIARLYPDVPILVLSSSLEDDVLRTSLGSGARGFLYRDADPVMITESIRWLARGESILDPRVTRTVIDWARRGGGPPAPQDAVLTQREIEVLRLVSKGEPNKRIARELGVTENTVKSYLRRVFEKLGCSSRSAATAEAVRRGLL
jgi:DNA-binding NarL/FixJ family response regulator